MSETRRYVLVDANDIEEEYEYDHYLDAYEEARRRNMAVVAHIYEYSDEDLVWTPNGDSTWPPVSGKS